MESTHHTEGQQARAISTREQINDSAALYGYRLPTAAERADIMRAEHAKMARLFDRVGNVDMATQARSAASKLKMQDEFTLRMLGDNVKLNRSQWLELLDSLLPDCDLARRINDLLAGPVDAPKASTDWSYRS